LNRTVAVIACNLTFSNPTFVPTKLELTAYTHPD
jgi:hypothetical protein